MICVAKPTRRCWVLGHACLCFPIRHAEGGEGARVVEERERKAGRDQVFFSTRQGGPHGHTESGVEHSPSMLEPVRPEAMSPDRALCLPTFSHFVIVNKTSLSLCILNPEVLFL